MGTVFDSNLLPLLPQQDVLFCTDHFLVVFWGTSDYLLMQVWMDAGGAGSCSGSQLLFCL